MRNTALATAAAFFMVSTPLWAAHPDEHGRVNLYAAGACAAPGYGTQPLQPGCCQCQSSCCDDVWAGYCQEKKHGFCLPCIRPMARQCAPMAPAINSNCSGTINASPPEQRLAPLPAPMKEIDPLPAPKTKSPPTPAPLLPPATAPPAPKPSASEKSSTPSDTTNAPFPVFNPAAWRRLPPLQ